MIRSFEELDYQKTQLGELILRRRKVPMLDNQIVYEVILNDEFLMSSLFHAAEDALADLGIAWCEGTDLDIVVGGLGLGYTAATALTHGRVRSLIVIEALAPVISWHRNALVPAATSLTSDPRTQLIEADFFAAAAGPEGFDPTSPGRRFDAILLDIDHTPKHWLNPANAAFYSPAGLRALSRFLHPNGVFAMWSDGAPDTEFLTLLQSAFDIAEARIVSFPNPIQDRESSSTVYLAKAPLPH